MAEPNMADKGDPMDGAAAASPGRIQLPVVGDTDVVVDQGDEGHVDVGEAPEFLQAAGGGHVEGDSSAAPRMRDSRPATLWKAAWGSEAPTAPLVQVVTPVHRSAGRRP